MLTNINFMREKLPNQLWLANLEESEEEPKEVVALQPPEQIDKRRHQRRLRRIQSQNILARTMHNVLHVLGLESAA